MLYVFYFDLARREDKHKNILFSGYTSDKKILRMLNFFFFCVLFTSFRIILFIFVLTQEF